MERLLGVRRDQRGPREIEEHELSVRSPPHGGERSRVAQSSWAEASSSTARLESAQPPDANRTSAARSGMAPPAAPRTRPNSPSPIGAPRASTAGRAATRHAGSRRPAVSLAELRESRHDGEGSDRPRRTIARCRSRRLSCARRTVRRVATTNGQEQDRQVTPWERQGSIELLRYALHNGWLQDA